MLLQAVWRYDSAQFRPVARHLAHVCRWSELTALRRLDQRYQFNRMRPLLLAELRTATQPLHQFMLLNTLLDYRRYVVQSVEEGGQNLCVNSVVYPRIPGPFLLGRLVLPIR